MCLCVWLPWVALDCGVSISIPERREEKAQIIRLTMGICITVVSQWYTIFIRSDAAATIYFIMEFFRLLFENSYYSRAAFIKLGRKMKKSTASRKVEWLQTPGSQSEETLPLLPL